MKDQARLYVCVLCQCQAVICSCCDRGNIYCGKTCADNARQQSRRETNRRYQNTREGKHKHAQRQHRYRQRQQKKIVTHQGSLDLGSHDVLQFEPTEKKESVTPSVNPDIHCHFCGKKCSDYLRTDFLRRYLGKASNVQSSWPLGP